MLNNIILEKIILPIGDLLTKGSFVKELKNLRVQDTLSEKKIEHLQKEKLEKLLEYSINNSKFYMDLNINLSSNISEDIKKFPILTKELLRNNTEKLLTKDKSKLIKQSSSGSSGLQTVVYFDKKEQSIQRAHQIRWWEWAGYKIGMPILQTGITPKRGFVKKIKDLLFQTYYMPAFSHSEKDVLKAISWARNKKKVVLAGYASSLYVISNIVEKNKIDTEFTTAITWGDKLFEHYKDKIKKVFNTHTYETYASSEGFMIAAKKDLDYLYIMTPNVYIEIVDDNGNEVLDGELGHVLVTKLDSYCMPMIRYKIGDLAIKLPKEKYPMNKQLPYPLLEKVIGRDTDIIKTRSGKFMVVHSFTGIIEHFEDIEQYSVVQKNLDGIEIEYIPTSNFKQETLINIKKKIINYLTESTFNIQFKEVSSIPPTPSGKPQIIRSYLKENT